MCSPPASPPARDSLHTEIFMQICCFVLFSEVVSESCLMVPGGSDVPAQLSHLNGKTKID